MSGKKEKTVVYVVDFCSKKVLLKEELNHGVSKKEQERVERVLSCVDLLKKSMQKENKVEKTTVEEKAS